MQLAGLQVVALSLWGLLLSLLLKLLRVQAELAAVLEQVEGRELELVQGRGWVPVLELQEPGLVQEQLPISHPLVEQWALLLAAEEVPEWFALHWGLESGLKRRLVRLLLG